MKLMPLPLTVFATMQLGLPDTNGTAANAASIAS